MRAPISPFPRFFVNNASGRRRVEQPGGLRCCDFNNHCRIGNDSTQRALQTPSPSHHTTHHDDVKKMRVEKIRNSHYLTIDVYHPERKRNLPSRTPITAELYLYLKDLVEYYRKHVIPTEEDASWHPILLRTAALRAPKNFTRFIDALSEHEPLDDMPLTQVEFNKLSCWVLSQPSRFEHWVQSRPAQAQGWMDWRTG